MAASGIVTLDTFLGYRKITSIKLQQNIKMLRKAIIKLSVVKAHLEFTKLDITAGDNTADHIEIISLSQHPVLVMAAIGELHVCAYSMTN